MFRVSFNRAKNLAEAACQNKQAAIKAGRLRGPAACRPKRLARSLKAVADPGFRQDVLWMSRVHLDFLAQLVDHDAEILVFLSVVGTPDGLQRAAMSDRLTLICHQQLQHVIFFWRQMNPVSANVDRARLKIDRQLPGQKVGDRFARREPAQGSSNTRKQFLDSERLHHVVVRSGIERRHFIAFGVAHRKHDDRRLGRTADFAARLDSSDPGHVHIEQNEVGLILANDVDGLLAGLRVHDDIPVSGKSRAQDAPDLRLVVNDENRGRGNQSRCIHARASRPATGSVNENTDPCPSRLVTPIEPPCAATIALAMGRPIPVPRIRSRWSLPRENLSKIIPCSKSSMPGPRSATLTTTESPLRSAEIVMGWSFGEYKLALSTSFISTSTVRSTSARTAGRASLMRTFTVRPASAARS